VKAVWIADGTTLEQLQLRLKNLPNLCITLVALSDRKLGQATKGGINEGKGTSQESASRVHSTNRRITG
jgi:hypothetical protein